MSVDRTQGGWIELALLWDQELLAQDQTAFVIAALQHALEQAGPGAYDPGENSEAFLRVRSAARAEVRDEVGAFVEARVDAVWATAEDGEAAAGRAREQALYALRAVAGILSVVAARLDQ